MNRRAEYVRFPLLYGISDYLASCIYDIINRGQIYGIENIPDEGPFIIAANHASFVDPPYIATQVPRQLAPFARKTLWNNKVASWWLNGVGCIPVDRDGGDVSAIRRVLQALQDDRGVLLFPEGTRSPDGSLQPAKAGVGLLACKTQVPIIPARIFNSHIALPRDGHLKLGVPVHVAFGSLIQPEDYDDPSQGKNRYQYASDKIMKEIACLHLPREMII